MRWLVGILLLLVIVGAAVGHYMMDMPYLKYSKWISGKGNDRYYEVSGFKELFYEPTGLDDIPPYQEDYVQLWKEFPLRNSLVPLPIRHPLFVTVPILEISANETTPHFGMILQGPSGREITRVYSMPNQLSKDYSNEQELFKLPFVRKKLLKKSVDELWKDVFSYKIKVAKKPIDDMVYDLYILYLRSKMLPPQTIRYGLIKDGKQAMIELESADKDYSVEVVMTQEAGSIFSYILKTERNHPESLKLRSKYLNSITFSPVDESIGRILYTEFKHLNYARQVDQEGMLYLFSAWSQNPENIELLKEMIQFLERGASNKKQLEVLYGYSFKRYKKTFTTRMTNDDADNAEVDLQRKIEIEQRQLKEAADTQTNKVPEVQELTPDEKINLYLKKAKDEKTKATGDIKVH